MSKITTNYVRVEDWSHSRLVENRGKTVAMEIARVNCSHCATCSRRMEMVGERVHRKGLEVNWERSGGGYFIVIPKPARKDPVNHLREVLGLSIQKR